VLIVLRLLSYLRPHWPVIAVTWVASIAVLVLQGLSVWVGAEFVAELLGGVREPVAGASGSELVAVLDRIARGLMERESRFEGLLLAIGVLIGSALLAAALRVLKHVIFARVNRDVITQVRIEMFQRLSELDLVFSRTHLHGEITTLFVQDADALRVAIIATVDRIFMQPLRLLAAAVLMCSLSLPLGALTIALLVMSSVSVRYSGQRLETVARRFMEKIGQLQGVLTEFLSAAVIARSLGRLGSERERFAKASRSLGRADVDLAVTNAIAPEVVNGLFIISGGVLLLVGGYQTLVTGTLNGEVLIKLVLLVPMASYPIEGLASLYLSWRRSMASAKRIFDLMDRPPARPEPPDAVQALPLREAIEIRGVGYRVEGLTILSGIDLRIERGTTVALCGPSGSGKTTLLGLIAGILDHSEGEITLDGLDIRRIRASSWQQRLGVVTQDPILLNASVRENLLYACPGASDAQLLEAMAAASIGCDEIDLDTPTGNRGELLSGGERQRLTIARALLTEPDVLIMDEPTTMLDSANRDRVRAAIEAAAQRCTLVMATHDQHLLEMADVVVQLQTGKMVAVDTTKTADQRHSAQ